MTTRVKGLNNVYINFLVPPLDFTNIKWVSMPIEYLKQSANSLSYKVEEDFRLFDEIVDAILSKRTPVIVVEADKPNYELLDNEYALLETVQNLIDVQIKELKIYEMKQKLPK